MLTMTPERLAALKATIQRALLDWKLANGDEPCDMLDANWELVQTVEQLQAETLAAIEVDARTRLPEGYSIAIDLFHTHSDVGLYNPEGDQVGVGYDREVRRAHRGQRAVEGPQGDAPRVQGHAAGQPHRVDDGARAHRAGAGRGLQDRPAVRRAQRVRSASMKRSQPTRLVRTERGWRRRIPIHHELIVFRQGDYVSFEEWDITHGDVWNVTHVPTGYSAGRYKTRAASKRACVRLATKAPRFTTIKQFMKVREQIRPLVFTPARLNEANQ